MAILLYVDGVLRNTRRVPIRESLVLYRTLKETQKVFIACKDRAECETWLRQHNLKAFDDLISDNVPVSSEILAVSQAEYVRSQGKLDMVITGDTLAAKELLERGFRTLLLLDPEYIDPSSRPDTKDGRKAWAEIQAELDKQQEMYAEDPRI